MLPFYTTAEVYEIWDSLVADLFHHLFSVSVALIFGICSYFLSSHTLFPSSVTTLIVFKSSSKNAEAAAQQFHHALRVLRLFASSTTASGHEPSIGVNEIPENGAPKAGGDVCLSGSKA